MLLGEPPRTSADLNFSLLGIPVRVHPYFWLVALLLGYRIMNDAISVLTWFAAVFIGVLVHEMGHAMTMRAYGLYPWITLYSFGGLASYDQRNSSRSSASGPLAQVLIDLAGPAAGFLLAGLLLLGVFAAGYGNSVEFDIFHGRIPNVLLPSLRLTNLINELLFVCVAWGVLNLLPIYPLDGGQVARELMLQADSRQGIQRSLQLSILTAVVVAVYWFAKWHSFFVPLMFGYLAFTNYVTLKAYRFRGPW